MSPGVQARKKHGPRKPSINTMSVEAKHNVQHRSDLLMNEHVRNVRQSQYELQSALQELEAAKGEEEIKTLRATVAELKTKSEKLVLALQVMSKINTELTFARNDLNDALHKGIGDINAARKRVIWLEDKMGELCGKKRLKSRRPSNRFVTDRTYGWDTDSDGEQTERRIPLGSTERMYQSENARHQTLTQLLGSEIGFTSDSEPLIPVHGGLQDMSYDSQEISASQSGQKGVVSSQEDISSSGKECHTGREAPTVSKVADHRRSLHDSMASLTSGGPGEIMEESGSEKFSTVKEASVAGGSPQMYGDSTEAEGASSPAVTVDIKLDTEAEEGRTTEGETTDQELGMTRLFEARTPIKIASGVDVESEEEEDDDEEEEEEERGSEEEEKDEEEEADPEEERIEDDAQEEEEKEGNEDEKDQEEEGEGDKKTEGKEDSTFITEVEEKHMMDASGVRESTPARDLGAEYWQSEHHRFEYSEFAEVFTEINPLSYHQMGLAVPGSFIQKEDTEYDYKELPWRARRKGSDIKDIHRIALDKLAARVHGMYDKVYDAAMMSVRASDQTKNLPRETSVFQSLDNELIKPGSSSSKSSAVPPLTAPASIRQKTEDKMPLPTGKEMKRGGTFAAGRLVFYPKPIPPPQVLPITRTSLNKEYPQFASSFSHPDPETRNPAERLVDQRNLLEETKLVLYHEKIKPSTPGPTRLERKFQKMLEKDRVHSHKAKKNGPDRAKKISTVELRKKVQGSFKAATVMAKFQGGSKSLPPLPEGTGVSSWNQIKPQSRGKEYSGLRWERVKTIVHMNLTSDRGEERVDAAKQLGLLRCGDTMVFYALKERLKSDPDERVRYEAAKSLILIGCWEDQVLEVILKYLVLGNTEVRTDLIETLSEGKNVQYVDKTIPPFVELVKILSHFCRNPDPDDLIAFDSAVCLGRLCVRDESAEHRLMQAMEESKDNHIRAKALEILVKQLACVDTHIVSHIQLLLRESPVWKYRALACRLLISLGPKNPIVMDNFEEIYSLLEQKLWDDPNMEVRLAAAKALTALGMFTRACLMVERKLEDNEEDARAQAAICVGTLGMKSEKLIRLSLEMLELDSSDYVRLMIIRTFGVLNLTDRRVLRCLKEREKLEGALGRESGKALKLIEQFMARHPSKSWTGPTTHKLLHSRRVLSPILASAM